MKKTKPAEQKTRRRKIFPALRKMRQLALLLWPHAQNHKGLLLVGATISMALIGLRLAQPWPLKWIIDILSENNSVPAWLRLPPEHAIALLSLSYIGVSLVAGFADYWQTILLSGLGNRIIYSFRNKAFDHLFRLPVSFHEKRTVGELVTRIVYDTSRLRRGVNGILIRTFQVVFTFLLNVVVILFLNWHIAIVIGVIGTLALLLMNRNGKRILSESRNNRRREGQLAAVVSEDMHGIREFQAFRPDHLTDERFDKRNIKSLASEQKVRRIAAKMSTQVEVLLAVGICVVLWIGAVAVNSGDLTVGSLVLISHYAVGLFGPFRQFARQAAQTGRTIACAERLTNIIEKDATITDSPDAVPLLVPPQIIRFLNVSIKNSRRQRVTRKWMLDNICCDIHSGERIAVIGRNGAGKSTLIKLLLRLSDPQLGSIEMDGKDIRQITINSLRSNISVLFQDSVFFGLTIRENIAFGKADATTEEIEQCVARCGIDHWISKLKKGLDTPIQRQGAIFSGGEKQKIAIARALLRNGNIWLLDEPTNDLDETSRENIIKLLLEVTNNRTTFWVTHDQSIIEHCTRVLLLDEGKVTFLGTPKEFSFWMEANPQEHRVVEQIVSTTNLKDGE
jgi:ATP-binding cassette, subfamily B, bacterial